MANGMEFLHCLLLSIVIAHTLSHGFVEGRRVVKDRELVRHKAAVKTIESEGDVIDCVDIYKQPAFDHPLLKNHKIQMKPSSIPNRMETHNYTVKFTQPWHKNGHCPEGTIPIKRTREPDILGLSGYGKKFGHILEDDPAAHEYAIAKESSGNRYYGGVATINVWNPTMGDDSELSVSQIWVAAGASTSVNSAEAGMMVYPLRNGDRETRIFIYWTRDNYVNTGCYNLECPGFVQTDRSVALGAIVAPVSNYGGDQFEIYILIFKAKNSSTVYPIQIGGLLANATLSLSQPVAFETLGWLRLRDQSTGHWWLQLQDKLVGYWAGSIFTTLADGATKLHWGGEIYNRQSQGHHTTTQMGSGHFPNEGYGKSSYIKLLGIVNSTNYIIPPWSLSTIITNPACYDVEIGEDPSTIYKNYIYYGGPGYSEQCE